jgi:FkbM family methyltransferase
MSIIHRFRSGGAPSHPYEGASHAPLRLDMEAAAIDGEALRSEINEFLANSQMAIERDGGQFELLIRGHHSILFTSTNLLTPKSPTRFYEETTTLLLSYLIERFRPSTFFDIGAGIGYFSRVAASRADCEVKVQAFEMRPDRLERLRASVATDPYGARVTSNLIGLTDGHKGETDIHYASSILFETLPDTNDYRERWRWLKFNVRGSFNRDFASAKVLMTSLDHFTETRNLAPDVIKIDVDGYEGRVLEGGMGMLARHKPFLLLELHKDKKLRFGVRRRDIANRLFDLGYRALFLTDHQDRLKCQVLDIERGDPLIDRQETDLILFYHPDYQRARETGAA